MLTPGMGPAGQGRVTEKGLHSVAAHPAHHLPSARRSKIPLPDPVLFLEPFTCHRSPEDSAVCYVSTVQNSKQIDPDHPISFGGQQSTGPL